jgi:hypothetical protein
VPTAFPGDADLAPFSPADLDAVAAELNGALDKPLAG